MYKRIIELPENHSFFLFGARGTGKSTLLRERFDGNAIWVDLLDPSVEDHFSRHPEALKATMQDALKSSHRIIIDEIQKAPKLLDMVHWGIEQYPSLQFILTGSSARKLRHGAANLLAGRAFYYHLFPFSFLELGDDFHLESALAYGMLPKLSHLNSHSDKTAFLESYTLLYLKEEVWAEHLIRKLDPFRRFLEIAAQMNGKILNFNKIARDVGVDDKTVKQYFSIVEETLIGFLLEPFHHSFRKRLSMSPKFYYFDCGVSHALARTLNLPLNPSTYQYGDTFEHFVMIECIKMVQTFHTDWKCSYLRTKDDAEIDLIVERPGKPLVCIEIKSSQHVEPTQLSTFIRLTEELGNCEAICLSNQTYSSSIDHVTVYPWKEGILTYLGKS